MRYFLCLFLLFNFSTIFAQHEYHKVEIENKKALFSKLKQAKSVTENQQKYDAIYYKLDIEVIPSQEIVKGLVQMNARVTDGPLNKIELDFTDGMQVDSVYISTVKVNYSHLEDIIDITLDKFYQAGETLTIYVYYQGNPKATGFGSFEFAIRNSKPIFWSLSEPYGARDWWPCKDIPEDKADSADVIITVPKGMSVASNGILFSETSNGSHTTFHWKEKYPIVTYLISVAAYDYMRYSDYYYTLSGDTMPIDFFVFEEHYQNSDFRYNYSRTKDMISAFAGYFGEYPFVDEKYGHAEFLWGGGMEHQTCTSLGGWSIGLIAHELGHQWWGDMITCRDFHHIWLNEGFATYCEALWYEYDEGMDSYHQDMAYNAYKGPGTIYVEDATEVGDIFNGNLSYAKASWILHMLRNVTGDSTFFNILKAYYADPRVQYGTAVTEDFRDICEEVSGIELDKYFQQWIYGEYYPKYQYSWKSTEVLGRYKIDLQVNQVQTNTVIFWMPIDVNIKTSGGDTMVVVWDSLQTQNFEIWADDQPSSLKLDEDNWILKDAEEVVSIDPDEKAWSIPGSFEIISVYPNPFNSQTTIEFSLPKASAISIDVYDIIGRKVENLISAKLYNAGIHRIQWDAKQLASGVYNIILRSGNETRFQKISLIK